MANRFLCGFDDYNTTGMAYEWQTANSPAIVSGLTGSCCEMVATTSSATLKQIRIAALPEGKASFFCGFRFMMTAQQINTYGIWAAGDATRTHIVLVLSSSGQLLAYRSGQDSNILNAMNPTSATSLGAGSTLLPSVSYYIEIEATIADSGGVFKVYLNGSATPDINVASGDTQNVGTAYAHWVQFGGAYSSPATPYNYFDDIYVNDTTGSKNTGLEGDVQVRSHMPNANGNSSQWDRSTGGDQYATIDDNPQDTADYNSTSVLNEVDTVNIASLADAGATIKAVQVNILAQKTTSGTAAIVPVMRVDSVDYPHATNLYVPGSWTYLRQNYDQQADSTDWNETDFNATEVGYKKTA